jgi:hypothetical protein
MNVSTVHMYSISGRKQMKTLIDSHRLTTIESDESHVTNEFVTVSIQHRKDEPSINSLRSIRDMS